MANTLIVPTDPAVIKALKDAAIEFSDSMYRIEAERDQCKAIVEAMEEKYELPKHCLNKMFKQYHASSFDKEAQEMDDYRELYEKVFK